MNGITKDTYKAASTDTKLDILFDLHCERNGDVKEILIRLASHPTDCGLRFEKLEKKSVRDTFVSGGMGLLAGFATMAAKLKFWG
jgi:hypothetical protein